MEAPRRESALLPMFIAALATVALYRFPQIWPAPESVWLGLSGLVYLAIGVASAVRSTLPIWVSGILIFAGILAGVTIDAMTDTSMERNLFPMEAIFVCVVALVPIAIGLVSGRFWRQRRK